MKNYGKIREINFVQKDICLFKNSSLISRRPSEPTIASQQLLDSGKGRVVKNGGKNYKLNKKSQYLHF